MHYTRLQKYGDPGEAKARRAPNGTNQTCTVAKCSTKAHARELCPAHLARWRLYGDPLGVAPEREQRTVEDLREQLYSGDFSGGTTSPAGYRYHTLRRGERYAEHRLMMEAHIGRELHAHESVHHKNWLKSDNRIENLELWTKYQPYGQRLEDLLAFIAEFYPEEMRKLL